MTSGFSGLEQCFSKIIQHRKKKQSLGGWYPQDRIDPSVCTSSCSIRNHHTHYIFWKSVSQFVITGSDHFTRFSSDSFDHLEIRAKHVDATALRLPATTGRVSAAWSGGERADCAVHQNPSGDGTSIHLSSPCLSLHGQDWNTQLASGSGSGGPLEATPLPPRVWCHSSNWRPVFRKWTQQTFLPWAWNCVFLDAGGNLLFIFVYIHSCYSQKHSTN